QTRIATSTDVYLAQTGLDLFGGTLPKQSSESDPQYALRVRSRIVRKGAVLPSIQQAVLDFYRSIIDETRARLVDAFAADTGTSVDIGAVDVLPPDIPDEALIPIVNVWDKQTRPDLAATTTDPVKNAPISYGVVVIQIMFREGVSAWYLGYAHLGIETYFVMPGVFSAYSGPPDPRLTVVLDNVIGTGIRPVYLIASS
ncbi:MAG: hypothetical protein M3Y06_01145, partial [Actinomycetota bacterium]|nr:hypothetical protein [Actinomycetota bacterium]